MYEESISLGSESTLTLSEVIPDYLTLMSYYTNLKESLESSISQTTYGYYSISISCQNHMFDSYFGFEAFSLSLSHVVRVQRIEERKETREIEIDLIEKNNGKK